MYERWTPRGRNYHTHKLDFYTGLSQQRSQEFKHFFRLTPQCRCCNDTVALTTTAFMKYLHSDDVDKIITSDVDITTKW